MDRRHPCHGRHRMEPMGNATWLDDHEQRVWRGFLRANAWIYDELENDLRAQAGLTLIEYGILVHLSEAPKQRMRMRRLADSVIVSKRSEEHTSELQSRCPL